MLTIGANRAIDLIVAKESGKGGGRRFGAAAAPGRVVGSHPEGGDITVRDGRYGPYVSHDGVNATLPKGKEPSQVTLEEAIELIAARIAQGGGKKTKKTSSRAAASPKKTAAKSATKAPAKKTTAAKTAAKEKAPASKTKTTAKTSSKKAAAKPDAKKPAAKKPTAKKKTAE